MKPLAEHQTVLQVLREIVEEAVLQASPAMATVTAVGADGSVKVRLLDEETSRPLAQLRNPSMRLKVNDTVVVIRTLANELVVAFPVSSVATGTEAQRIGAEQLVDGAVSGTKLADGAVTQAKIGTGAVTAEKIGAGAVTADKIQTGAVIAGKIATGAVGNAQIAGGAVTSDKIASGVIPTSFTPGANSITSAMLQNGSVTAGKLGTGAVQPGNVGPGAVGTDQIAAAAVTTGKINDLAVTQEKIAAGAVGPAKLAQSYSLSNHGHVDKQGWKDIRQATLNVVGTPNPGNKSLEAAIQQVFRKAFNDNTIKIEQIP